ncbi:hypothetical protein DVS28_a4932 [Euzebya pacifica]|uniref:DUF4349 domain-containing protein n=1 Tax=Euzebya pacifica TaxID=1608957 RepID=A0A346Y542_9ACTN|nr:DUF4349 domain-containing protein [Euzebya pacifica]AXV09589.1 hypothetical protein DVS28_a4932 [Euzebya pacifica]
MDHTPTQLPHHRRATTRRRRWTVRRSAAIAVLLLLLAGACSSDESGDDSAVESVAEGREDSVESADADFGFGDEAEVAEEGAAAPAEPGATTDVADSSTDDAPTGPVSVPDTATTGERIIKEGTVTLEVEPGFFDTAFGQVIARAQALGGHVSGSSSSTDTEGLVQGQVTVRVPVRSFEDLLTAVGEAGDIVDRNVTSQDVSEEFTDLESRRRNLRAQEGFYLGLLADATNVSDAIAIQQQLEDIQRRIEEITGRLNLLADRSSFSTLTVRIHERGADAVEEVVEDGPQLGTYVETARNTLIDVIGGLLVIATVLLPFLLLGLGVWAIVRTVRRRRPPVTAQPYVHPVAPPAAPEEERVPEPQG